MRLLKLLCAFTWAVSLTLPVAAVTVTDATAPDGRRLVTVENAAIRLVVNPAQGGRISSFIYKPTGADWVLPGNAGFFMDHVWQQSWPGELLGRPYEVTVIDSGPDKATIEAAVTIDGKGDKAIEGVRLVRRMTVTGDSPRVDVTIRLENPTPEPRAPGLWVQNVVNVGGSRDGVWTWRPTARGTIRGSFDTRLSKPIPDGYKDDFAFDPTAGWSAETYPTTGEGVVFFMDYNYLRTLYNNGGSQSVEWWYDQVRLAPGKSFETRMVLWPVSGMNAVTHASLDLIGDLQMVVNGDDLDLTNRIVAGPESAPGKAKVKLQLIDYDTGKELASQEFDQAVIGSPPPEQKLAIANAPLSKNLLARATVTTADGKSHVYENYRPGPAVIGTEKLYRINRPSRVRPIERPAIIAKTPHAGFRLLHLRGLFQNYYRMPEVAKAMGAELKHGSYRIFVYGPSLSYFPSDYPELMSYDVIVLDNVPIEALDDQTLQYLSDYTENGGVLSVIGGHWAFGGGGYKDSRLEALLPVTTVGRHDIRPIKKGYWSNGRSSGPVADAIGTAWIQDVKVRPEADVWFNAGNKPFLVSWRRGKGMAAVMTGVCYGEAPKGMTLFWEWSDWPEWFAESLKKMVEATGKP